MAAIVYKMTLILPVVILINIQVIIVHDMDQHHKKILNAWKHICSRFIFVMIRTLFSEYHWSMEGVSTHATQTTVRKTTL